MPPRPPIVTPAAGQPGAIGFLAELKAWHDLETQWVVPAGASVAEVQDIVSDCEAEYAGVDGGGGTVVLSPGRYDWPSGSTVLCEKTATSIIGSSPASCVVYHPGSEPAIRWANDPTTTQQQGGLAGFTLLGDGSSLGIGVHCFDTATCPSFRDLVVHGFGAAGIWLENDAIWNERFTGDRLRLDDNKVGLLMSAPSGSLFNSFGYARVNSLFLGVNSGQVGIRSAGSALVYNGKWNLQFNGGGGTSVGVRVDAESNWSSVEVHCTGEALAVGADVVPGGVFNISGFWAPGAPDQGVMGGGVVFNGTGQIMSGANLPMGVAMGAFAGAGAPAAVVKGSVLDGDVTFGSGSNPQAGDFMVLVWGWPFQSLRTDKRPSLVITPMGDGSVDLGLNIKPGSLSQTGCVLRCRNAMAANQPNTTYGFTYHLLG